MDFIIDAINEWITNLLVDGIMGNLTGLFDNINSEVSGLQEMWEKHRHNGMAVFSP